MRELHHCLSETEFAEQTQIFGLVTKTRLSHIRALRFDAHLQLPTSNSANADPGDQW